jgi:hypothetical protein
MDYYDHVFESKQGVSAGDILSDLPPSLKHELEYAVVVPQLRKIPMFEEIADTVEGDYFLKLCVKKLALRVAIPGEFIVEEGDTGELMYLITR